MKRAARSFMKMYSTRGTTSESVRRDRIELAGAVVNQFGSLQFKLPFRTPSHKLLSQSCAGGPARLLQQVGKNY